MKKVSIITLISASIVASILSCRHQPIDRVNTPGGVTCSADTAYFQQQVLPIFISNCTESNCHHTGINPFTNLPNIPPKGVVLTGYDSIMITGDVRPGLPDSSLVYKMITETDPSKRMPKGQPPLPAEQINIIRKWILQGAKNNSCLASACDSTNVTFSGTIRPIITNKCLGCHSGTPPQGNINYSTYNGVKAKVDDGRLWGAINHFPGFSPMPKGGAKLSDCEIKQFRKWMDAGAPNN